MSDDVTDADKVCAHDVFEHLLAGDPEGTRRAVETITNHRTQSVAALQADYEKLREAARAMLPHGVCLTNRNVPDEFEVALEVTVTMGELRTLAALSNGEGSK